MALPSFSSLGGRGGGGERGSRLLPIEARRLGKKRLKRGESRGTPFGIMGKRGGREVIFLESKIRKFKGDEKKRGEFCRSHGLTGKKKEKNTNCS